MSAIEARAWANKLRGEAEGRMADCCVEGMTDEEMAESIQDMLLDFCSDKKVPQEIIGEVATILNCYSSKLEYPEGWDRFRY